MNEYGNRITFDGCTLHETDRYSDWFETESEAYEDAYERVDSYIEDWKAEGSWNGETEADFEIEIIER